MQQSAGQRAMTGPAVVGVLLIAFGAAALVLRQLEVSPFAAIATWGWPLGELGVRVGAHPARRGLGTAPLRAPRS